MRIPLPGRNTVLTTLFIAILAVGFTTLLFAQRPQVRQMIRTNSDGAYLGIQMEEVTADNMAKYRLSSESGVIVGSVEKGSPAEAARLQENDVILEYSGIPVLSMATLSRLVQETPVNRTITLTVSRDGKKINLSARLNARPQTQAAPESRSFAIGPDNVWRNFDLRPFGGNNFGLLTPRDGSGRWNIVTTRPRLGITVEILSSQMAGFLGVTGKSGVLVTNVDSGSPAASSLKAGDVILSVAQKPVSSPADLTQAVAGLSPGTKAEFRIVRDKKEVSVTVELPKSTGSRGGVIL